MTALRNSRLPIRRRAERGAILVVSMILLLVMTILAITISQTSWLQERMTGNNRDSDLAFQSAEAGMRAAEKYIADQITQPATCTTSPCAVFSNGILPTDLTSQSATTFWAAKGTEYGTTGTQDIAGVTGDPQYVIEELGFVSDSLTVGKGSTTGRTFYRTTGHGTGRQGTASAPTTEAVVQGTFVRRY